MALEREPSRSATASEDFAHGLLSMEIGLAALEPQGRLFLSSPHEHIFELPRILFIDVLGKEHRATFKRRPIGVLPDDRAKIRALHIEAAAEVEFVGFNNTGSRVFKRPDHSR